MSSPGASASHAPTRFRRAALAALAAVVCLATSATAAGPATAGEPGAGVAAATTPVQRWLAGTTSYIAHRGGSASWPEGSPLAYRNAVAWSPDLALEFPARRTVDGVWVASDEATTRRVFGKDLTIATTTWSKLSTLRSIDGNQMMSRLKETVLAKVPRDRVLVVDDKDDAHVAELLALLGQYGGPSRTIIKSYYQFANTPPRAHTKGYLTWGYWYQSELSQFAATQGKFDLLAMQWDAPASTFRTMLATGKKVFAHVVATQAQAQAGLDKGATGLMVSGVTAVVPPG